MSSRLNPRDYDLGELRDAVRESSRHRDGSRGGRRDDGRRDVHRDDRRADGSTNGVGPAEAVRSSNRDSSIEERLSNGGAPQANGASDGASGDEAPSPSADADAGNDAAVGRGAEGRSRQDDRSGGDSSPGPSNGGRSGGRVDPARNGEGRPAVGRMRRNRRRFARSSSRDRTPDGAPRRREDAGAEAAEAEAAGPEDDSEWRPGGRAGRSDPARGAADLGTGGRADRSTGPRAGGFELASAASSGDLERPYLDRLPQGYRAQVEIFAWLEGLLATCGRESTLDALAYYEDVGWLSEESRGNLEDFVEGLTAAEPPDPRPPEVDDHRTSLRYVARLSLRVDR